jgi:hypothetical protein
MLLIKHRVNSLKDLSAVPRNQGVEIDVRDFGGEICCAHDPFTRGELLRDLLGGYAHAFAIFNVKADGLESHIMQLADEMKISSYFFLDCANPTLVGLARKGFTKVAVRYSEYEPLEFALAFAEKVEWVWIDCFSTLPLDASSHEQLRRWFKICIVSPELQGHPRQRIGQFRQALQALPVDAVCTDYPEDWTS